MAETAPASLDSAALSRRLGQLAGHERTVQVEFLLHLAEFDDRRAWAEAGYPSLWEWCLCVLHLREGAAGRRIGAMRVLRRLPALAEALRDGRICLSTVTLLGPLLTEENCAELLARAAFMRKRDVEHLVASLAPRVAPKEGVRLLSAVSPQESRPVDASHAVPARVAQPSPRPSPSQGEGEKHAQPSTNPSSSQGEGEMPRSPRPPTPPSVQPVAADAYSLRVTVDGTFKKELDELKALLAHKVPSGDLAAVLREAVHCALEKHGQRKGAVEPSRKRKSPPPRTSTPPLATQGERPSNPIGSTREHIPVAVRREVWKRDGGKCVWRGEDGRACGSMWKLELDHVVPAALGGPSTVENLRLHCRSHNVLRAERVFGRAHLDLFRREQPQTGEAAIPGGRPGDAARDTEGAPREPGLPASP
jgi:hypothetical protein